jgi:hypothetical protein
MKDDENDENHKYIKDEYNWNIKKNIFRPFNISNADYNNKNLK